MQNLKRNIRPITTFIKIDVKRLFRDKVAIFFVFAFPLIFLFVFGGIFGSNSDISFDVALINNSDSEFAKQVVEGSKKDEIIKINEEIHTLEQAKEKMNRSEIDATIILPEDFGTIGNKTYPTGQAQVLYDQNNEQAGQTLASIMDGIFKEINSQFVDTEVPFTVVTESTATKGLTQFDFTFSGLLGFSILSLGIFGPTNVFPRLKQKGVLRRYHTTTLKVWQYFVANVVSNSVAGILSIIAMFVVALTVFDLKMRGNYLELVVVVLLGIAVMFGIGLAIGGWAKNENQAAPLSNLVSFPMMFLSGVFFPTFLMPQWLQNITQFIPLTPIVDAIRKIVTEGQHLTALGTELGIMVAWGVVIYIIAFKVFRWE